MEVRNTKYLIICAIFVFLFLPYFAEARECEDCWCLRPDGFCEYHEDMDGTTGEPIETDTDCNAYCNSRTTNGEPWRAIHCDHSWFFIDWNSKDPSDPCFNKTVQSTTPSETQTQTPTTVMPAEPKLQILDIPVQFSKIVISEDEGTQYITVPWLAEYIAAIYQYLVGVATILAIVMMMYGGFRWIIAGGDAGKIGEARKTIAQAAIGLVLALGSYAVLNLVNPNLVSFKALKLILVERTTFAYDWTPIDVPAQTAPGLPSTYTPGKAAPPDSIGNNGVPHFSQVDKRWGDKKNPENLRWFGEAKNMQCEEKGISVGQGTIAGSGCMCTSVTMILAWYKAKLNQSWDIDPVIFCTLLGCRGHVHFGDKFPEGPWGGYNARKFTDVDELKRLVATKPILILGHPVLQYRSNGAKAVNLGHYMVVTGYEDGKFLINDPGSIKFPQTYIPEDLMRNPVKATNEEFKSIYEKTLKSKGSTREKNKPRAYWFYEITPAQ